MNRFEVIPHRYWRNAVNSRTASLYGAVPYTSAADAKNWAVVDHGFTIRDNKTGTVGGYQSCPTGSSKDHADMVTTGLNQVYNQRMAQFAHVAA